jgi:hypothetical protein
MTRQRGRSEIAATRTRCESVGGAALASQESTGAFRSRRNTVRRQDLCSGEKRRCAGETLAGFQPGRSYLRIDTSQLYGFVDSSCRGLRRTHLIDKQSPLRYFSGATWQKRSPPMDFEVPEKIKALTSTIDEFVDQQLILLEAKFRFYHGQTKDARFQPLIQFVHVLERTAQQIVDHSRL